MMRKDLHYLRRFLAVIVGLVLSAVIILPAMAEEDRPSADLSVSFLSDYIWRGQELSRDSMVIQPSMTIGYKGFSANVWGNLDTDPYVSDGNSPSNWNETDLTLAYSRSLGPVNARVGYIYYSLDGVDDSQEVFMGLGLNALLSPTLTVYREMDSYMHWYALLGVSHTFKITEAASLNLCASVSYLKSDDADEYPEIAGGGVRTGNKFDNFHDGLISASLPISVAKYITVTPSLSYVFPLSDDAGDEMKFRSKTGSDDNYVYGGITASLTF
jgi:hypothetical protein